MGSFNNYGFYSKLPIEYGDEIVLIPLVSPDYEITNIQPTTHNISFIGSNYIPLCLPIYGTYNDYGFIENVVDDENTKALCKKLELSTIYELLTHIEQWGDEHTKYYFEVSEDYEHTEDVESTVLGSAKTVYEDMVKLGLTKKFSSISFCIELKEVYEYAIHQSTDYLQTLKHLYDEYESNRQKVIKNIETLRNLQDGSGGKLQIMGETVFDRCYDFFKCINRFGNMGYGHHLNLNVVYNNPSQITNWFVDEYIKFATFLSFMHYNGGCLMESQYCGQLIKYDVLIQIEEKKLEILKRKYKKI